MVRDFVQCLPEPRKRLHLVDLAGSQQGVNHGGLSGSIMGAGEQVIFPVDNPEHNHPTGF
tara:strand:+ start:600 stop:779 length:180 start_codon:yes stop_codon:yes gene_type:complete